MRYILSLTLLCLLSMPAFADDPEWTISGRSPDYPDAEYLTEVGSATLDEENPDASYDDADASARTRLAAMLETHIESVFDSFKEEVIERYGEVETHRYQGIISDQTRATVTQDLKYTEISKRYISEDKIVYALATLERTITAASMETEYTDLLEKLESKMKFVKDEEADFFQALPVLNELKLLYPKIRVLQGKYRFIVRAELPDPEIAFGDIIDLQYEKSKVLSLAYIPFVTVDEEPYTSLNLRNTLKHELNFAGLKAKYVKRYLRGFTFEDLLDEDVEDIADLLPEGTQYLLLAHINSNLSSQMELPSSDLTLYAFRAKIDLIIIDLKNDSLVSALEINNTEETKDVQIYRDRAAMGSYEKGVEILQREFGKILEDQFLSPEEAEEE